MNPVSHKKRTNSSGSCVYYRESVSNNKERKKELMTVSSHKKRKLILMLPDKFRVDKAMEQYGHSNIKSASGSDCALTLEIDLMKKHIMLIKNL